MGKDWVGPEWGNAIWQRAQPNMVSRGWDNLTGFLVDGNDWGMTRCAESEGYARRSYYAKLGLALDPQYQEISPLVSRCQDCFPMVKTGCQIDWTGRRVSHNFHDVLALFLCQEVLQEEGTRGPADNLCGP